MKTFVCALFLSLVSLPATACTLALVLAIDISNSVDRGEYRVQTEGVAEALLDPLVRESLVAGQMAVTVMLWSGPDAQYVVIPWRRMLTDGDVMAMAAEARAIERIYQQSNTALGAAIDYATRLFDLVPDCVRKTIDVSGDGQDNAGTDPGNARNRAHAEGVTINGIAIDRQSTPLTRYFRSRVMTPNGFVMTSQGHRSYVDTLRRKMQREVADPMF